jgi:hypothetical protein|tara:strand:+ start:516 stop:821 length:306 start_codon:yes stop_codon:yes gene_type:complete
MGRNARRPAEGDRMTDAREPRIPPLPDPQWDACPWCGVSLQAKQIMKQNDDVEMDSVHTDCPKCRKPIIIEGKWVLEIQPIRAGRTQADMAYLEAMEDGES